MFLMRGYLSVKGLGLFPGSYFGWTGGCTGEIAHFSSPYFSWEILTDPSYHRKIVIADSETVENRWPTPDDIQSFMPHLSGLVILGRLENAANENSHFTLDNFLSTNQISGFIPDRSELLRDALRFTSRAIASMDRIRSRAEENILKPMVQSPADLKAISAPQEYLWDLATGEMPDESRNLAVWDFGINYNLMKNLRALGCKLRVMPPNTSPERMIALHPDGIVIAGGPLEQSNIDTFLPSLERVVGIRPTLGVGNGALILARALGITLEELQHPHYGAAIPVEDYTGRVTATYQSHSLSVNRKSLEKSGTEITHLNVCDGSIEGFTNREYTAMGTLFSITPESVPIFLADFMANLDKIMGGA